MHVIPPSQPARDDRIARQLVLRDGSAAIVRPATPADIGAMRRFFEALSAESRYQRFLTAGSPSDDVIARLSESADPRRSFTLVAQRMVHGNLVIVAAASYLAITAEVAEAAFAVADDFQGKGIATALLERLAVTAGQSGFRRFQATTLAGNTPMLEVFRDSGFEIRSKSAGGSVDVQLSLASSEAGVASEERRHQLATTASLCPLLEPHAVAVVGASRRAASIGRRVLTALRSADFNGPIYAVNPHAEEIDGVKAYASARELPSGVDLAVVTVPAASVLSVVDDCAAAGVKALVVITAGFAEVGAEGRALQEQLAAKVRSYGMRMVGPNCMGLLNAGPSIRLNASFSPIFPPSGRIGLLSQSGALGIAILELASERGLGLSSFISVGNKADVSGNDLLEFWSSDPSTDVILLYLESFGNPRRFARLARRIGREKPIVVVKSGRSRGGSRAASSHTAALAANDAAVDALFAQSGVIRADTLDDMFDIAACLETQPLPEGPRVGIITNAGGPGILAADACEAAGLTVADLSSETQARLTAALPAIATCTNPIDMVASAGPEEYRRTVETMLSSPDVDSVIVIFTPVGAGSTDDITRAIQDGMAEATRAGTARKPALTCIMGHRGAGVYPFPEHAAWALSHVTKYARWRAETPGLMWGFDDLHADDARTICRDAIERRGSTWLTGDEVRRVLCAFGLPIAASAVAHTAEEASALAAVMGYPVVAKSNSPNVLHKTDIGAVRLDLADGPAVARAFREIEAAVHTAFPQGPADGVLIQPMIAGGVETIMGITQDPVFGPLIAFGLGGVYVEVLGDVRFRIAPLTDHDVDQLLHGIKGFPLLEGYRGHAAADLDALREILLRLSRLADEVPEIAELDLNPVIAMAPGHGCRIVDARIRVASTAKV